MRRAARTAWLTFALAAAFGLDAAAEVPPAINQVLEPLTSPRMRLGAGADRSSEPEPLVPRPELRPDPKPQQCRKWRAMAVQLGETFAGHSLRETVLKRVCAGFGSERRDEIWNWPWGVFADGRLMPPRLHRSMGAWQIRCGTAASRKRCALLQSVDVHADGALVAGTPQIITHVVIDMIAGRESVLWRVFVPSQGGPTKDANLETRSDAPPRQLSARERPALVYQVGALELTDKFSTCVPAGCMMEASLKNAGAVVSALWDGTPIELRMPEPGAGEQIVRVSARGFKAGLAELIRLRRDELRGEKR